MCSSDLSARLLSLEDIVRGSRIPPAGDPVDEEASPPRPGRVSKPMIVAAAVAGLVLVAAPFGVSRLLAAPSPVAVPKPMHSYGDQSVVVDGFVPDSTTQDALVPPTGQGTAQVPAAVAAPAPAAAPVALAAAPKAAASGARPNAGQHPGTGAAAAAGGSANRAVAPAAAPPPATYAAVGGPSCTASGASTSKVGYYTDGKSGWLTSSGGDTADGCGGQYYALPMSGDASKDDGNHFLWTFKTGAVHSGTCQVSVFVPTAAIEYVGGDPAYYTVHDSTGTSDQVGSFTVNQVSDHGWVSAGSFPVANGQFTVELHTRGQDWEGDKVTYAHLAAAQIRLRCTA